MKPLVTWLFLLVGTSSAWAQAVPETTVGMPKRLNDLILPGPRLEAKPLEDRTSPIVLRVLQARPDGEGYRYDIEFFALEPGPHDLKEYLKRSDGSPNSNLPAIVVQVNPVLPPGQIEPNKLEINRSPWLGGYRLLVIVAGIVWGIGLTLIVASFFFPRSRLTESSKSDQPLTLADKLRPLVEGAVAGKLSQPELSQLERHLHAFWRKRLHLEQTLPDEAITILRQHPEAGPLLQQMEDWLHNPEPGGPINVEALLKPYTQMAEEALPITRDANP